MKQIDGEMKQIDGEMMQNVLGRCPMDKVTMTIIAVDCDHFRVER